MLPVHCIDGAMTAALEQLRTLTEPEAVLRAKARLRECLEMGEDGYTELQSVYDDAVKAGLSGQDVDEAKELLELIKNAQRHFVTR